MRRARWLRWIAALWLLVAAEAAWAALSFELRTGASVSNTQSLTVDSNKCPAEGPTAMYVGGRLTNTGSAAITNIVASISGLTADVYLAGGQPATQEIGTLGPGESANVFWFVGYSCAIGTSVTPAISFTSSAGTTLSTPTLTIRSAISANAGGNVASTTLGAGAVVGQLVYFDANFTFGNTKRGDEYFLQPSGGQNFDAACFRLVGSEIIASNRNAAPAGSLDRLYYIQPGRQPGNTGYISVRYTFQYMCADRSTTARPYAVQTSGSTNIKYTGNFDGSGSVSVSYPPATNPFTISKLVSPTSGYVGIGSGILTYTVTLTNPSPYPSYSREIIDILPAGVSYIGLAPNSAVTAANSSSVPASGATGTLSFKGKLGQSYYVPAGGSITLIYTANRPATAGSYTNTAKAYFGYASTPDATATYNQAILVPLTVSKTSNVHSDPVNALTDPKAIPGAMIDYTISITNPNSGPVDANSVIVTDKTPAHTSFCVADFGIAGSGPVDFADGTPASGLSYSFASLASATDGIEFSSDDGATWTYVPVADARGCDAAVTHWRVRPAGTLAGSGSFTLRMRYLLL